MKLTLTKITRYDKDKDNQPLKTKDGRPYTRLVIGTKEYPKNLSGFDSIQTQNWREGDEVEVEVEQKGEYLNFKLPNKQDLIGKGLEEVLGKLATLNLGMQELLRWKRLQTGETKPTIPYPEGEPPMPFPDETPF